VHDIRIEGCTLGNHDAGQASAQVFSHGRPLYPMTSAAIVERATLASTSRQEKKPIGWR
jgi:hypothetical protein